MLVRGLLIMLVFGFFACSSDEEKKMDEPVAPAPNAAAVPDTPGTAGEAAVEAPKAPEPAKTAKKEVVEVQQSGALFVSPSRLNVRSGPGMNFKVTRMLNHNEKIAVLGTENLIWVKIGENEFVSSKYLTEKQTKKPSDPVASAKPETTKPAAAAAEPAAQPATKAEQPQTAPQQPEAAPQQPQTAPQQQPNQ